MIKLPESVARIIDKCAGAWMDYRTKVDMPDDMKARVLEFQQTPGEMRAVLSSSVIPHLASDAAELMEAWGGKNYLEFEMMPRPDRSRRPIRVTVQWADGCSPAEKAERLQHELEKLRGQPG